MSLSGLNESKPSFIKALPIYLANFVLLLLSTQTMDFVTLSNVHTILFLIPLFYWTIHNPNVMPLWFIFLSGLVIDFTVDSLLGLHAFVFVVYYIVLYRVRRIVMSQPVMYHFVIFAMSATVFELMRWILLSVLMWQVGAIFPSLLGVVLNIILFFPIMLVLRFLHRVMSGNGRRQSL